MQVNPVMQVTVHDRCAQGMMAQQDPAEQLVRALYQQNPSNPDLGYMVEMFDARSQQVQ